MTTKRNFYELLEIPPDASVEDIRRAYRRLVKSVHPDTSSEDDATRRFQSLQEAYETLNEPRSRALYDARLAKSRAREQQTAAFRIRLQVSRRELQLLPEDQALYVLAEIHGGAGPVARPVVNLCLALDRSLSMDGERLRRAQDAACFLIDQLDAGDILSVVAFSDRARVVVDGFTSAERSVARDSVRSVLARGGTELLQGLRLAIEQLQKRRTAGSIDHLILLTDGNTYGDEAGCLEAAALAGQEKIGMTLLGLGAEWNDRLLDEMAARSGGYSAYVDSPSKLTSIFQERLSGLLDLAARDVQVALHPQANASLHAAYLLTPDIAPLTLDNNIARLGMLQNTHPIRILVEMLVRGAAPGPLSVLRLAVSGDLMKAGNERDTVESAVQISWAAQPTPAEVPKELEDLVARLAVFKVQEKAIAEVERGEHRQATVRLENLATQLKSIGEVELANATLLEAGELALTGQLSPEGRKRIRYGTRSLGPPPPPPPPSTADLP